MSVHSKAFNQIDRLETSGKRVAVSYSGGKDSMVIMDLCKARLKSFKAFFWFAVPGLEICERQMRVAVERWGIEVEQMPHWDTCINAMKSGTWCDPANEFKGMPAMTLKQAYAQALDSLECDVILTGMKDADGLMRRHFFANIRDNVTAKAFWDKIHHPIKEWSKKDVLDYLRMKNIPLPDAEKKAVTSGVGLGHDSLCWLHDSHPQDFQKLTKWFPYAEAAIKRREWFGVA